MNPAVTKYINDSEERNQPILRSLRELILSSVPNVNERLKWSRPVYATDENFCYLKATKKAVTLGFFEYDKVKTNSHLLEGTGKSMRHVKIGRVEDIDGCEVAKMISEVLE